MALVAIAAFRLPEPPRGQFEKSDVLGEVITESSPAPISVEAAFARLLQIRTLKTVLLAFTALGFGLLTVPILQNLFLEDQYDVGTFGRGVVGSLMGVGVLATLPWVARYYDRLYRQDPERALRLVGLLVMPAALATPFQYYMPNVVLFTILGIPFSVLLSSAFVMVGPLAYHNAEKPSASACFASSTTLSTEFVQLVSPMRTAAPPDCHAAGGR